MSKYPASCPLHFPLFISPSSLSSQNIQPKCHRPPHHQPATYHIPFCLLTPQSGLNSKLPVLPPFTASRGPPQRKHMDKMKRALLIRHFDLSRAHNNHRYGVTVLCSLPFPPVSLLSPYPLKPHNFHILHGQISGHWARRLLNSALLLSHPLLEWSWPSLTHLLWLTHHTPQTLLSNLGRTLESPGGCFSFRP